MPGGVPGLSSARGRRRRAAGRPSAVQTAGGTPRQLTCLRLPTANLWQRMMSGAWAGTPIWDASCCCPPLTAVPCLRPGPRRAVRPGFEYGVWVDGRCVGAYSPDPSAVVLSFPSQLASPAGAAGQLRPPPPPDSTATAAQPAVVEEEDESARGEAPAMEAALRAELSGLRLSALQRRARAVGVGEAALEDALDSEAPSTTMVELAVGETVSIC